jgi:protein-tyrosine phosphatase
MKTINVLFVCMGNICRSPTAHGVFQKLVEEAELADTVIIDSAGTHAYHVGNSPDRRSQIAAKGRGYDLSDLRARRVETSDFENYDYVLAMDQDNYRILSSICPPEMQGKLDMFLAFSDEYSEIEVPDPYYGGDQGFERVLDMVESASTGLLQAIRDKHGL